MSARQDEGTYALQLSQSVLFKSLTGQIWYYRADDDDMVIAVETNRRALESEQRVVSLDKLTPRTLRECEIHHLFKLTLDRIELAHGAYWNSRLWC